MRKYVILLGLLLSTYLVLQLNYINKDIENLSPSSNIDRQTTKLEYQRNLETNIRNYLKEFTFSNPKVIVGGDDSPLSVQIVFNTKEETGITVDAFKDEEHLLSKKFEKNTKHVLNITGLISGEKNTIYLYDDKNNMKKIEVQVPKINLHYINLNLGTRLSDRDIYLYVSPIDKSVVGLDNQMRVRYYLKNYLTPYIVNNSGDFLTVDEQTLNSSGISRAIIKRKFNGKISEQIEIEGGVYTGVTESVKEYIVISPGENDNNFKLKKISKDNIDNIVSKDFKRENSKTIVNNFKIYINDKTIILIDYGSKRIYLLDLDTLQVKKEIDLSNKLDNFRVLQIQDGKLILENRKIIQNKNNTLVNFKGDKDRKILDLETKEIKEFTDYTTDFITNDIVEDVKVISINDLNTTNINDELKERYAKDRDPYILSEKDRFIINLERYNTNENMEKYYKKKYSNVNQSILYPTTKEYAEMYRFSAALDLDSVFNEKLINIYQVGDYIAINAVVNKKDKINLVIREQNSSMIKKFPLDVVGNYKKINTMTKEYTGKDLEYLYLKDVKKITADTISNVYIEINGRIYDIHRFFIPNHRGG